MDVAIFVVSGLFLFCTKPFISVVLIFSALEAKQLLKAVAYPGILFGGGIQQIQYSVENRGQRESGGGSPLVRGSGWSCNLVQEISFHIVKFS